MFVLAEKLLKKTLINDPSSITYFSHLITVQFVSSGTNLIISQKQSQKEELKKSLPRVLLYMLMQQVFQDIKTCWFDGSVTIRECGIFLLFNVLWQWYKRYKSDPTVSFHHHHHDLRHQYSIWRPTSIDEGTQGRQCSSNFFFVSSNQNWTRISISVMYSPCRLFPPCLLLKRGE